MKKKIAIVSGGAGFIGSHMVDLLLSKNFKVRVIDNLSTGSSKNLNHIKDRKNFKFKKKDITKLKKNDKIFKNVDFVFHFAGIADLVPSIESPEKYIETNLNGTIKMLQASRHNNIKKFVYAASASCYGINNSKVKESDQIKIEHPYALSKYLGEMAVFHWSKVYKLKVNSIRIFNAYGPRSRTSGAYGAVIGVFLKQKLAKQPFTVVGSGNQSRDFVHVKDVVKAFFLASLSKKENGIYNVASSKPQKINYLVKLIGGKKIYIPNRPGEAFRSWANISKIKNKLGWKPSISFKEGIEDLIDQIDNWKSAPLWDRKSIKKATKNWFKFLK